MKNFAAPADLTLAMLFGRQRVRFLPRALTGLLVLPAVALGQGPVDPTHGLVAVGGTLRGLGSVKRVLVIGAHPDDEDTELLATLVRGQGADAAYLSLNRGEGGQNLIGPELGVGLGLLRTEELLAARRLDGADQFFTRAYDFGYSKSAAETFQRWPRDSLLADVVRVVRSYRPQVIVSIFGGTSRDGHGQHQAAGLLAREAFEIAGNPERFAGHLQEGLRPWTPLKLYRSTRFDPGATTIEIETGRFDPLYGRSYHQIAMAGRSQHRSQDMGRVETLGPRKTRLQLLASRVPAPTDGAESSIFSGVDTTLTGMLSDIETRPRRARLQQLLTEYQRQVQWARNSFTGGSAARLPNRIAGALSALRGVLAAVNEAGHVASALGATLREDERDLQRGLSQAAGLIVAAFTDDDLVVPGQSVQVEVQVWNGGSEQVKLRSLDLRAPMGWVVKGPRDEVAELQAGELIRRRFEVGVPEAAPPSRPYFLRSGRWEDAYRWPDDASTHTQPFDPPLIEARAVLVVLGEEVLRQTEAVHRYADQARGEVRRSLRVVPPIGLALLPTSMVWPLGGTGGREVRVTLSSQSPGGDRGRVRLEVPAGWHAGPGEQPFDLSGPSRSGTVEFRVSAATGVYPDTYRVRAVAETTDGQRYQLGYSVIEYPHIRRNLLFEEAEARISVFELEVDHDLRVAYIPGAGDAVADAIAAMGVSVEVLDGRAVATGSLSGYDAIVLGIRAYETNPALAVGNDRLLDWVREGGTLIVQYQQYGFFNGNYAPYQLAARFPHDRVSDETAPVDLLIPDHPVFNYPNRITERDLEGWVHERGLYFASEWDRRYRPLLQTADKGEQPKRGGLLVASLGKGVYVYTGLALFRQLPAGVPGGYRLLANLLSLSE